MSFKNSKHGLEEHFTPADGIMFCHYCDKGLKTTKPARMHQHLRHYHPDLITRSSESSIDSGDGDSDAEEMMEVAAKISNRKIPKRTPSRTWQHFEQQNGNSICRYCGDEFTGARTSNLMRHIKTVHPLVMANSASESLGLVEDVVIEEITRDDPCEDIHITVLENKVDDNAQMVAKVSRNKPSSAWLHFEQRNGLSVCRYCKRELKSTHTANLFRHLKKVHPEKFLSPPGAKKGTLKEVEEKIYDEEFEEITYENPQMADFGPSESTRLHFKTVGNSSYCKYCNERILSLSGSTLLRHLRKKHPAVVISAHSVDSEANVSLESEDLLAEEYQAVASLHNYAVIQPTEKSPKELESDINGGNRTSNHSRNDASEELRDFLRFKKPRLSDRTVKYPSVRNRRFFSNTITVAPTNPATSELAAGNELFLKSLLPLMNQLSSEDLLDIRIEIQNSLKRRLFPKKTPVSSNRTEENKMDTSIAGEEVIGHEVEEHGSEGNEVAKHVVIRNVEAHESEGTEVVEHIVSRNVEAHESEGKEVVEHVVLAIESDNVDTTCTGNM